MKLYARLVVALGFPIAAACTLSLPLILLGAVAPDPRPWNWPTVYIVDFLYGLALFSQLVGFLCRTSRNRLWTAAVGGYTALAFGQAALEALLDLLGVQPAPITAKWFLFLFMSAGLILGALMLLLTAVLYFDTAAKLYTQQVDFPLRSVAYYAAAIACGAYQWRRSAPSRAKPDAKPEN